MATTRLMLRAWRNVTNEECSTSAMLREWREMSERKRCTSKVFNEWSQRVPTSTRTWARLFSKLEFEHHRQKPHTAGAEGREWTIDRSNGWAEPGVARLFGASNARQMRKVFQEFMKDLSAEEREEMRFMLHAEAIRRGLGRYSITARRAMGQPI